MASKALILVDLENEWMDKSSDYFVGNISGLLKKTNQLIDFCRKNGYKIIFTAHIETGSDSAFVPNSKNVEIIKELHQKNSDALITKNKISPFYKTKLEKELRGVEEIVICGILTNLCVRSLAEEAYDRDFQVIIIKDCCRALDTETHEFTIKDLQATRKEIKCLSLNEFLKDN